jgi:plastocyanin
MDTSSRPLATLPAFALLALLATACGGGGGDGDGGTEPPRTGNIRVSVTTDGANAAGVTLRLFAPGSSTSNRNSNTGTNGTVTFEDLDPGTWEVAVDVPQGTELSAGTAERQSVAVTAGETAQLTFALETAADGDVVEVVLTSNLTFSPAQVTISPGMTIRWRNEANIFHTVTPDGHSEWSEASLNQAGQVFTHTFQTAGEFAYYCSPHRSQGMTGTITVQ